jgi:type I restriction enzyme S subunit
MASEWRKLTVQDFAEVIGGGTPSTKDAANFGGEIPWITPKDLSIHSGMYISKGERSITKMGLESSAARILPPKTVLLTTRAPVGYLAIAANELATNQGFHSLVVRDSFSPEFVYYLLLNDVERLRSFAVGSTFQELSGSTLRKMDHLVPPLPEQRAIAHILRTLDEKIELNRRTNETLEAMARALFKSWFIDFDPVRAKAEGRDPGLPADIAALFPDSFQDSDLGEIPIGWRVKGLDEIADFLNGLALQSFPPHDGRSLPVIKIAQLRAGSAQGADAASADLDASYVVDDGDVLFSWSGSLECVLWTGGVGALNQHLFKVTSAVYPKWFYYYWIQHHLGSFREIAAGKATTMGHIQRHHLSDAKVVVPGRTALNGIDKTLSPIVRQFIQLRLESRTLATLRDTLLPKLLSGEVRVKDVRRFEEASS